MERLIKDLATSDAISQNFLESEVEMVKNSISSFSNLVPKFRSTLRVSGDDRFIVELSSHE